MFLWIGLFCEFIGGFLTKETPQSIIEGGAKKVVYSALSKDDSQTIVMGVNQEKYESTCKRPSRPLSAP